MAYQLPAHIHVDFQISQLTQFASPRNSLLISDENVWKHYGAQLSQWDVLILPAGESSKNWENIQVALSRCVQLQLDRKAFIIGLGGGVVTDLAAFVASIYNRGVGCILIPTSLLAMADAAIGGKNGINFLGEKNIVGTIRQPSFILYDFDLIVTLPLEEWKNGMAEVIKHAFITGEPHVQFLEQTTKMPWEDGTFLYEMIVQNIQIKSSIVAQDEQELGNRKILNFGHTIGHAIESAYSWPHGRAIAIGMIAAAYLSETFFGFKQAPVLKKMIKKFGLPTAGNFDSVALIRHIFYDKKRLQQDIQFILLQHIGQPVIHPLPLSQLAEWLKIIPVVRESS